MYTRTPSMKEKMRTLLWWKAELIAYGFVPGLLFGFLAKSWLL